MSESAASGIIAGINLARALDGEKPLELPETCMTAALARHISTENKDFQPMGRIWEYFRRSPKG